MVEAVRRGASLRQVADRFGVALATVQRWVRRAGRKRLERVDWSDRPCGLSTPANRTSREVEDLVLDLRQHLRDTSALGEFGAEAIHRELEARDLDEAPSVRTIGRILERRGLLDHRQRVRRRPPPLGWYLPAVAAGRVELDSFDTIEGLMLPRQTSLDVLTGVSLHGGLVAAWPMTQITAKDVVAALVAHWRTFGLPAYAQFDNDNRFQGPHQYADVIGRVMRTCLSLGVMPVFVPPRETGFQAAIESLNGRWQAKVWARFGDLALPNFLERSAQYVAASRQRSAVRIEGAPARRPFPAKWQLDLQAPPRGQVVFLRRTNARGEAELLGHTFWVAAHWLHRLVRAEVDLTRSRIRFYALRRRQTEQQPLLHEVRYVLPRRTFKE
jgi:transposase-like protein